MHNKRGQMGGSYQEPKGSTFLIMLVVGILLVGGLVVAGYFVYENVLSNVDNEDAEQENPSQNQVETCNDQLLECWDGSLVERDPDNDCNFFACPEEPVTCTNETNTCWDGSVVGKNPDDDCNFFACPPEPPEPEPRLLEDLLNPVSCEDEFSVTFEEGGVAGYDTFKLSIGNEGYKEQVNLIDQLDTGELLVGGFFKNTTAFQERSTLALILIAPNGEISCFTMNPVSQSDYYVEITGNMNLINNEEDLLLFSPKRTAPHIKLADDGGIYYLEVAAPSEISIPVRLVKYSFEGEVEWYQYLFDYVEDDFLTVSSGITENDDGTIQVISGGLTSWDELTDTGQFKLQTTTLTSEGIIVNQATLAESIFSSTFEFDQFTFYKGFETFDNGDYLISGTQLIITNDSQQSEGYASHQVVQKYTANNTLLWNYTSELEEALYFQIGIVKLENGELAIVSVPYEASQSIGNAPVIRILASNGTETFNSYGTASGTLFQEMIGTEAIRSQDGNILITGIGDDTGVLMKMSAETGEILWQRAIQGFEIPTSSIFFGNQLADTHLIRLIELDTGELVVGGSTLAGYLVNDTYETVFNGTIINETYTFTQYQHDFFVAKTDPNGNI